MLNLLTCAWPTDLCLTYWHVLDLTCVWPTDLCLTWPVFDRLTCAWPMTSAWPTDPCLPHWHVWLTHLFDLLTCLWLIELCLTYQPVLTCLTYRPALDLLTCVWPTDCVWPTVFDLLTCVWPWSPPAVWWGRWPVAVATRHCWSYCGWRWVRVGSVWPWSGRGVQETWWDSLILHASLTADNQNTHTEDNRSTMSRNMYLLSTGFIKHFSAYTCIYPAG